MENLVSNVKNWLKLSHHIVAPLDWLQACIEWIQEEHGQNISHNIGELNNLVLEQWLLSDLTETGATCLPEDILQHKKYQLIGAFCLQINSIVDASSSYYSQLQKVQGTENENEHVSATQFTQSQSGNNTNRMLIMDLTDGTTNVKGMEYKNIPGLNVNIKLGTKIVVHGEVLCRLGVLMLKGCNVHILGGEVDSFTTTHEESLKIALNNNEQLKENPQTREFKGSGKFVKKGESSISQSNNQQIFGTQRRQFHQNATTYGSSQYKPTYSAPQELKNEATNMDIDWEDDFDDEILFEQALMSDPKPTAVNNTTLPFNRPSITSQNPVNRMSIHSVNNYNKSNIQNRGKVNSQKSQTQVEINNRAISYPLTNDRSSLSNTVENNCSGSKRLSESGEQLTGNNAKRQCTSNNEFKTEIKKEDHEDWDVECEFSLDSIIADVETEEQNVMKKEESVETEAVLLRHPQFRYIIELKHKPDRQQCVKVKAYISTLLGKLEFNNGKFWSLSVKLNDGTHSVEVDISDQVLSKLIGYRAEQCLSVKKSGTREEKVKIAGGLKQCQKYLIEMSAVFELEVGGMLNRPCMKEIIPITDDHQEYFPHPITR